MVSPICIIISMKTAIVLTGRHDITDDMYLPIIKELKAQGWERVIFYEPDWSVRSVRRLVSDFMEKVPDDAQPLTLLGFSLGAMIALIASGKLDVENLILCSPSGYFSEYDKILTDEDRTWAEKELTDFRSFSAAQTIHNARVMRGILLAGEDELKAWPDFRQWINDLKQQTGWRYIKIPNTGHEIGAPTYQAQIQNIINRLASSVLSSSINL